MNKSLAALLLTPALLLGTAANSAPFPDRPVSLIVPYPPGGGSDNIARTTAQVLSHIWKQPVLVENKPGADGMIATRQVMRDKPDGHSLLITIPAIAALKYINKGSGEDPLSKLRPVSMLASGPSGLVVKGNSGINNIADLKRVCGQEKANCSWASGESFTLLVGTGLLKSMGLTNVTNVRYPGTSAAVNDVIGGHVTMVVTGLAAMVPHHKSGALKILALSSDKRSEEIPDVPTYAEAGMGDVTFINNWYGIFVPQDTPDDIVEKIAADLHTASQDPAVLKVLKPLLITPVGSTPKEFAAVVKQAEIDVAAMSDQLTQ